jgi:hypothetical protein
MDFTKAVSISTGTSTASYLNINSITTAPTAGTPFSGYMIESLSYANGQYSGFSDTLAQRDGLDTDIALLPQRNTTIIVAVYGSSSADFYDKLNDLNSALQPYPAFAESDDGFRAMDFTQPTNIAAYSTNGIPMRLAVRPTSLPIYNLSSTIVSPQTSDRGLTTRVSVSLISKDPRKLCQTPVTGSISLSSGTGTASLTNNGNYSAYPTFTITSNLTTAGTLTVSTSLWTTALSIGTGSKTTILNSTLRTVTSNGSLLMSSLTSATTEMPYLPAGASVVTVAFTGGAGYPSSISYSYQEAWI